MDVDSSSRIFLVFSGVYEGKNRLVEFTLGYVYNLIFVDLFRVHGVTLDAIRFYGLMRWWVFALDACKTHSKLFRGKRK